MTREEEITKIFKKYDMPTSNPFFFEILKGLEPYEDCISRAEAINIKDEILRKEGSIHICNVITIDGVVLIKDVLGIIDKHLAESEG